MWGWEFWVLGLGGPAQVAGGLRALPVREGGPHPPNQTGKCDVRDGAGREEGRKRGNLTLLLDDQLL